MQEPPEERPPEPPARRGSAAPDWVAIPFLIPLVIVGFFRGMFTNGRPVPQRERRLMCLAIAMLAALLLCACLGPLILAGFLALSTLETPTTPGAEIAFALLYTLFGLLFLLVVYRIRDFIPNPPRRGLALLFSDGSIVFWIGVALCGIALAQLALPAYARWLGILFWIVAGIVVLLPLVGGVFNLLRRRLRRRVAAP